MKQLNRPKRLLLSYILLSFGFVSASAQDFEGVWYPSSDEGMIGNIKIKKEGDEYVVQYKTKAYGLKTSKGTITNNELHFYFLEKTTHGEFWLGEWDGERDCILVGKDYGHYGTNGSASQIYDHSYNSRQNCATIENEYWDFKLVPEGDNLTLFNTVAIYYGVNTYSDGMRIVFKQGGNFVECKTYTNW